MEKLAVFCWTLAAPCLIVTGLRCSAALKFIHFRHPFRCLKESLYTLIRGEKGAFGALCTALAGAAGTGNIAGVSTALAVGGAGSLVWMCLFSLLGTATAYREASLLCPFGGSPMKALKEGMHASLPAAFYAFCLAGCGLAMGCMVQSGAAAEAMEAAFSMPKWVSGALLAAGALTVLAGGARLLCATASALTPLMSLLWMGLCLLITVLKREALPHALQQLLYSAAGIKSAAAGFAGAVLTRSIRVGMARGVFSNEAGLGSLGLMLGEQERDPRRCGRLAALAVCIDTPLMCTLTGLAVILATPFANCSTPSAVEAIGLVLGQGAARLAAVCTLLFAFGTVIAWSYCGCKGFAWLTKGKALWLYRWICCAAAAAGACLQSGLVWGLADCFNALLAFPNCLLLWQFRTFPLPRTEKKR